MHKIECLKDKLFYGKAPISKVIYTQTSEAIAAAGAQQPRLLKLEMHF